MSTSKSFNPQSLISHLTNSNGCGNVRIQFLLPVPPFHPFLLPPPGVFSRNRRLLPSYAPRGANISPVLTTLRILPVATGVYRDPVPPSSVSLCLYGKSRVLSSLQPLFAKHRGWGIPGPSRRSDAPFASRMYLRDLQTFKPSGGGYPL